MERHPIQLYGASEIITLAIIKYASVINRNSHCKECEQCPVLSCGSQSVDKKTKVNALIGPIPWGHSGPLCHALSLSSSSSSWTSIRRRRATVAAVNDNVKRLAVANGPNIFQMLLVGESNNIQLRSLHLADVCSYTIPK